MSDAETPALPSKTTTAADVLTRNQVGCTEAEALTLAGNVGESTEGKAADEPGANGEPNVNGPATNVPSAPAVLAGCVPE